MSDEKNYEVVQFLSIIPDPRINRCKRYSLESILFISLVGMLCGADSAHQIADFTDGNKYWIKNDVELPDGIPSHDTISRVFSLIDKNIFYRMFKPIFRNLQVPP